MKKVLILLCLLLSLAANARERLNFNADWRLCVGDFAVILLKSMRVRRLYGVARLSVLYTNVYVTFCRRNGIR